MGLLNWHAEENVVENNKDNRIFVYGTIGLTVAYWNFNVLKISIFVLGTSNFHGATISR